MDKCKWLKKELCGCKDCPMWMKYCPLSDFPGVCKFEENTPLRHPTDDTSPRGEALGETKEDKRWMYLKR